MIDTVETVTTENYRCTKVISGSNYVSFIVNANGDYDLTASYIKDGHTVHLLLANGELSDKGITFFPHGGFIE